MNVNDTDMRTFMWMMDALDNHICEKYKGTPFEAAFGFVFGEIMPKLDPNSMIEPPPREYTLENIMDGSIEKEAKE